LGNWMPRLKQQVPACEAGLNDKVLESKKTDASIMALNICMNKYTSTVRVRGQAIKMAVFADSRIHAHLIL
jgi:hypothetical protein